MLKECANSVGLDFGKEGSLERRRSYLRSCPTVNCMV